MNINQNITAEKRAIANTEKRIIALLGNNAPTINAFRNITRSLKINRSKTHGLDAVDDNDEPAWYESKFVTDLWSLGTSAAQSKLIGDNEAKQLSLELQKLEAQNASLDKQITLQSRLKSAGQYGGSFFDELLASPVKMAGIAVGVWALIAKPWK